MISLPFVGTDVFGDLSFFAMGVLGKRRSESCAIVARSTIKLWDRCSHPTILACDTSCIVMDRLDFDPYQVNPNVQFGFEVMLFKRQPLLFKLEEWVVYTSDLNSLVLVQI